MNNSMEIGDRETSNGSICGNDKNGLHLYQVAANVYGEGLPYAPENWPNPGDRWRWKTGKRVAHSGHFLDRYLYPPQRLNARRGTRSGLASKQSVEQYVRKAFPDADINSFFASFSWKIPGKKSSAVKDSEEEFLPLESSAEPSPISQGEAPACNAGNRSCSSLEAVDSPPRFMPCDICCNEPGFCRDCCCVLCCKTISSANGDHSYFRCNALVDGYICGHVAHINCSLRAYLAGTVGGSIGLDVEYYCRRCDSRSDLLSHVHKILKACELSESRNQIEEMLEVGVRILGDSKRVIAKQLLHYISKAMKKLKSGADLEDIWKEEDVFTHKAGSSLDENGDVVLLADVKETRKRRGRSPAAFLSEFNYKIESLLLKNDIDQILQSLKKSQECEYKIAEEALTTQKNLIQYLYKELDYERSEYPMNASSKNADAPPYDGVKKRIDQIQKEIQKLEEMKAVADGFGRAPKRILNEHYGLETERI